MFNLLLAALIVDSLGIMMQTVVASRGNYTKIGIIPDEHVLSFQISLPLKNQTGSDKFLIDLYNYKHENFENILNLTNSMKDFPDPNKTSSFYRKNWREKVLQWIQ